MFNIFKKKKKDGQRNKENQFINLFSINISYIYYYNGKEIFTGLYNWIFYKLN